jgi:hypothetical protein
MVKDWKLKRLPCIIWWALVRMKGRKAFTHTNTHTHTHTHTLRGREKGEEREISKIRNDAVISKKISSAATDWKKQGTVPSLELPGEHSPAYIMISAH